MTYRACFPTGQKKVTATFRTKDEAEKWLNAMKAQVDSGSYVAPTKMTLADLVQRWMQDYAKSNVGAKTRERYEQLLRVHVVPALGQIPVTKLMPLHLTGPYTDIAEDPRSPDGPPCPCLRSTFGYRSGYREPFRRGSTRLDETLRET